MLVLGALTASPLQQNMQYQNETKFAKKKKKTVKTQALYRIYKIR